MNFMKYFLLFVVICLGCGRSPNPSLPEDIPLYPQSAIQKVIATPTGNLFNLSTADAYMKVLDFYPKTLEEQGWTVVVYREKIGGLITARKADRHCNITCYNEKDHTRITITVESK